MIPTAGVSPASSPASAAALLAGSGFRRPRVLPALAKDEDDAQRWGVFC